MYPTIFTTPIIRHFFYMLAWIGLKLTGWKMEGEPPKEKKYVLIAVPHTTNWDFPITLAFSFISGIKIYWMGKDSLFKGILGPIMRYLGGISIDRSKTNNTVDQIVAAYNRAEEMVVTIPVEGTRAKVDKWRTGFYYIATGAKVPIGRAYLDYKKKIGGFQSTFYPTGDVEADIAELQAGYQGISGLYEWKDGEKIKIKRDRA